MYQGDIAKQTIATTLQSVLRPSIAGQSKISNLAQLLFAEEVLDEMAAQDDVGLEYKLLLLKAEAFIKANPELLATPWLRNGGAVYDLILELKEKMVAEAEALCQSACSTALDN